jgi:hypothetical protein
MNGNIKTGDLVMVVRGAPCCGFIGNWKFGETFLVDCITAYPPRSTCRKCGFLADGVTAASNGIHVIPTSMLKKIEPPATGDDLPVHIQLTEPAALGVT